MRKCTAKLHRKDYSSGLRLGYFSPAGNDLQVHCRYDSTNRPTQILYNTALTALQRTLACAHLTAGLHT